jgi:hypothetical protein
MRRHSVQSGRPRCVMAMLVMLLSRERFRMACSRPCGANSMVMALGGMCCDASSKSTALSRLLVWYSADECVTDGLFHSLSGTEEHTQREDRGFGSGITCACTNTTEPVCTNTTEPLRTNTTKTVCTWSVYTIWTSSHHIVTNSQVLFHNGSLLHSKSSIHNSWLQFTTLLQF